ncbi:TRAP transporter small permease [Pseudothauera nasutitermitis]|uniref:TRAP transporter small permease protein n=1 Tax=Pseudothauera nasutitermitis TaxID=2565930 RepID=A0A4S4B052_9RHOO|nr:TRAP transporter small permease [Pseudothauera nasutitermitis]THF65850.1 TRAP transporter small permease [Pseudothauera nasutitermitis]
MRNFLDGLYASCAWLAGLSMIGVLAMVLLSIVSRQMGFSAPGVDAYAGYAMAGAGFFALAATLQRNEHIRVTLVLGMLKGKAHKALDVAALLIATLLSAFLAFYSARLVWQSWLYEDISVGIDATPLWIPQIPMAIGTAVFCIAFVDRLLVTLLTRHEPAHREIGHHE